MSEFDAVLPEERHQHRAAIHGAAILLASGAVPIRQLDEVIANVTLYALRGIEVDRRE